MNININIMHVKDAMAELKSKKQIGFIGAGKIAQALATSLVNFGNADFMIPGNQLHVSAPSDRNMHFWDQLGSTQHRSNRSLVVKSNVIILAVPPRKFLEVISDATTQGLSQNIAKDEKLFISVIRGMPLEYLIEHLKKITSNLTVVRAVPNSFVRLGIGFTVYTMKPITDDDLIVEAFFAFGGHYKEVPERDIDACYGMIESGPSVVLTIIEAIADGGDMIGLPRQLATRFAAQVTYGAAMIVLVGLFGDEGFLPASSTESKLKHVAELKSAVCTPAGSAIASLHALEKGSLRAVFIDVVEAATREAERISVD